MRALLLLVVSLAILGCRGGNEAPPLPPPPPPGLGAQYTLFESLPTRPLALSPDGSRLFAVNTPDAHLEIFSLASGTPSHLASVPVGLEPVAVAARTDGEVWVVNHLSDSVSVVDVASDPPRVVRTLLVGDEPEDVVFAGPGGTRAFVTTAHRGQASPYPRGEHDTPGVGRADVYVFDATNLGTSLEGDRLGIVTLFGDRPRALAVSPDGTRVYAAIYKSGNGTTTIAEGAVCDGGPTAPPCSVSGMLVPGGLPGPRTNHEGDPAPETGLIVRFDGSAWRDELGRDWSSAVRFSLPDDDVFAIDAMAATPAVVETWNTVGTVLYAMAVSPTTGRLFVANTEAMNHVRFEGPGTYVASQGAPDGVAPSVRGRLHEARISLLGDGGTVVSEHLNPHIPYGTSPMPPGIAADSLATPMGMAVSADGTTLYLAAYGSSKVAVLDVAALENGALVPSASDHVEIAAGGPTGLALDEARGRLYVHARFEDAIVTVDTTSRTVLATTHLHDPEPASVREGRRMLYDARLSSSHGEASCGSCHVGGDMDDLAWDLGDPDGDVVANPNPRGVIAFGADFHPMKGPMTTQTLRGLSHAGPMHWRGDRTGGSVIGGDPLDEVAAFDAFAPAFDGLLGRDEGPLQPDRMRAFTTFALQIAMPPNPIRALDNSLRADEARGRAFYDTTVVDTVATCNGCHRLDRAEGAYGTDGTTTFENETQEFKVAHLRNAYQKVGMFGMPSVSFIRPHAGTSMGPQIRGFGFLHDGSIDTLDRFLRATVFQFPDATTRADVVAFVMAFDTELSPIVGQQITLDTARAAVVGPRIELLEARADAPLVQAGGTTTGECDLVVRGVIGGAPRGFLRSAGTYRTDRAGEAPLTSSALRALVANPGDVLTFTCVPPGTGERLGIDRDRDGALDGDERALGTDPADRSERPGAS